MIKKEDCKGMQFNPFDLKHNKQRLWQRYPEFAKRKVFSDHTAWKGDHKIVSTEAEEVYASWGDPELNMMLTFIILLIDEESPLYGEKDFDFRKNEAKRLAGVRGSFNDYSERRNPHGRVNLEIEMDTDYYHSIFFEYFKMINRYDYEQWFSEKMSFHQMGMFMRKKPPDEEKELVTHMNTKSKIKKEMKAYLESLIEIESRLFPDRQTEKIISRKATEGSVGRYVEKFAEEKSWA